MRRSRATRSSAPTASCPSSSTPASGASRPWTARSASPACPRRRPPRRRSSASTLARSCAPSPTRRLRSSSSSSAAWPSRREPRHDLFAKPPQLLLHDGLRRAHADAHVDVLQPGEAGLEVLEVGRELLGRSREPGARLHVVLHGRDAGGAPAAATGGCLDLGGRDPRDEAERREHLHVLLVEGRDLADGLLAGLGEVKEDAEAKILAEGELTAGARRGLAVGVDRPLGHGGGAAADDALDAVANPEVESAAARAHVGLPALHGPVARARDERELAH